jgi:hypothetical protein
MEFGKFSPVRKGQYPSDKIGQVQKIDMAILPTIRNPGLDSVIFLNGCRRYLMGKAARFPYADGAASFRLRITRVAFTTSMVSSQDSCGLP